MKQFLIKLKTLLNYKIFIIIIFLFLLIRPIYLLINVNQLTLSNSKKISGTVKDYQINGNKLTIKTRNDLLIYYFKDEEELSDFKINYGDYVKASGKYELFKKNTIPYNFNNQIYQKLNGYDGYFKIDKLSLKKSKNPFYLIKNKITLYLNHYEDNAYYLALITGNKSLLDSDIEEMYRVNGISHLLSISGLHLGIFIFSLDCLLKELHFKPKYRFIANLLLIAMLLFITNYSASLIRASLLFIMIKINNKYHLVDSNQKVLCYVLIMILLFNYHMIFNIGFIFSYLCTYTLLSINISKNKIIGLLQISINTLLVTAPIVIKLNHSINLLSIICNLLLVPFMSYLLLPSLLISIIIPFFNPFTSLLITIFNVINNIFYQIPLFNITMPDIPYYLIIVYYLVFYFYLKRQKYIVILIFILIVIKIFPYLNNNYLITYLDVGQGDSIILISPHQRKVIMIDTGGKVDYKNEFTYYKKYRQIDSSINYLKGLGINHLDYLIITHGDYDHMGEAINLVNNFKVEKVIFNCGEYNDLEKKLIKVLNQKKINYYSCINKLDNLTFLNTKDFNNENDNSNVIYTELNGYKFMFMGDASVTIEKEILSKYNLPNIDVLKVGHHGSKTSCSKEFISEINPRYSIISVGKNNRYGHPNKEVLDNLYNSKIYRTDQDGSIMFKIKNNKLRIETCSP